MTENLLKSVFDATFQQGGITVDLEGKSPNFGFVASFKAATESLPIVEFTPEAIQGFITRHWRALHKQDRFLGTWRNGETVELSVSQRFDDLESAMEFAAEQDQLEVWNLSANVGLDVSEYFLGLLHE